MTKDGGRGSDKRPALTSVLIAFCSIDIKSFENGDLIYAKKKKHSVQNPVRVVRYHMGGCSLVEGAIGAGR